VRLDSALPEWAQRILCDPQTSGGLLAAVSPESASKVLELFHIAGFSSATFIGRMQKGKSEVHVTP